MQQPNSKSTQPRSKTYCVTLYIDGPTTILSPMQISENTRHLLDRDGSFNYIRRENRPASCGNIETYWLIGRNSVARYAIELDLSIIYCSSDNDSSSRNPWHQQPLLIHKSFRSLNMSRTWRTSFCVENFFMSKNVLKHIVI